MIFLHSADPVSTWTHIPASISDTPTTAIGFSSAKVSMRGHLWSTHIMDAKSFQKVLCLITLHPYSLSLFFVNFDKGNIFENNYIKTLKSHKIIKYHIKERRSCKPQSRVKTQGPCPALPAHMQFLARKRGQPSVLSL